MLDQTPYEAWKGVKPSIAHLKVFGCIAYALTNSSHLKKLDDKSKKCIFVGYCTETKAYKLYNPNSNKVIIRGNVTFDKESK